MSTPNTDQIQLPKLLDDIGLGEIADMAPATFRVQRHLRRTGKPHWFNVDPIYVGSSPRYLPEEVTDFFNRLKAERDPFKNHHCQR